MTKQPQVINELVKQIRKEKKEILKSCWKYHKELIRDQGPDPKMTINELEDFIIDSEYKEWEDVAFYAGYVRGLDFAIEALQPEE